MSSGPPARSGAGVHCFPTPEALADEAARLFVRMARASVRDTGAFRVALAGGNTPRATYQRLAQPDLAPHVRWDRVHLFFGDERMVPAVDPASNYCMVRDALVDHVPIPNANVHRIRAEVGAALAAERYAVELGEEPLDLVFLGMGEDGHVASLFPGGPELAYEGRSVAPSRAPVEPLERVTLTFTALNAARAVLFLVTGASKAVRLAEVFRQRAKGAPKLPAARISPTNGQLGWYLDAEAAPFMDGTSDPPPDL